VSQNLTPENSAAGPYAGTGRGRPGWLEVAAAAAAYVLLLLVGVVVLRSIPDGDDITAGITGYVVSAVVAAGAFGAAVAVRIRRVTAFGVRPVATRWLVLGAGLGVGAYVLNIVVAVLYGVLTGDTGTPQGDYQAAAGGGALAFALTLVLGAIATPIGEELAFRGVLANALSRYGAWVGVLLSSAVFALAHGLNVILPIAFVVGLAAGWLLLRTGSIWPGVVVHAVNNGLSVVVPALLALPAG
jgi:membrane protease YdiL (CAAX protease family)